MPDSARRRSRAYEAFSQSGLGRRSPEWGQAEIRLGEGTGFSLNMEPPVRFMPRKMVWSQRLGLAGYPQVREGATVRQGDL